MQAILNFAIEFIVFGSAALFAIAFISGYSRWQPKTAAIPTLSAEDKPIAQQLSEAWKDATEPIAIELGVVPFTRKAPDLKRLKIRELKAIAQRVKLAKYSNNPTSVLVERLSELPAWTLREAIG
jgi:hypothetical protein